MGREVRRVPKDFDWPLGMIWPGFFLSVCSEMDDIAKDKSREERCKLCRKWARLSGIGVSGRGSFRCPDLDKFRNPPEGPSYQLWNTTTEGHPMSPPFEKPEDLARWLVDNKISSLGHFTSTYEEWLEFIRGPGWAPSGVMALDGEGRSEVMSGVSAMSKMKKKGKKKGG